MKSIFILALAILAVGNPAMADAPQQQPLNLNIGAAITENELASLQKAALDGDGVAAFRLSRHFRFANVNRGEELYWLRIAAENGNLAGQYNFGYELATRERSERNLVRAVFWLRKAKAAGVDIPPEFVSEFGRNLDAPERNK